MLRRIKQMIYWPYATLKIWIKFREYRCINTESPRLFLLNIPSHGNLGDHLLSVAEHEFFNDNFPQLQIIPVTSADLYYSMRFSLSAVRPNDVLCLTGGGFLGSLYDEEERFLTILKRFPRNKVIVLPQTIYYEDNEKGRLAFERALLQYKSHPNLYVVARDQSSFNLLNDSLMRGKEDKIALTPDLALYLKKSFDGDRNGVLWCMRNDVEVNVSNNAIVEELNKQLDSLSLKSGHTDTYVSYHIPYEQEELEVQKKLVEFSRVKLVITDRLHGMIYSAITGTPVIAMDNISGKVGQVYERWLSDINYVRFVSSQQEAEGLITEMLDLIDCNYDNRAIKNNYQPIIDFINA